VAQIEAGNIAEAIMHFKAVGVRGSDIAVLYPKHVFGDRVEEALLRNSIPYRRYGNVSIMDRYALHF
jgi:superfamily I DNA/RNA helicase